MDIIEKMNIYSSKLVKNLNEVTLTHNTLLKQAVDNHDSKKLKEQILEYLFSNIDVFMDNFSSDGLILKKSITVKSRFKCYDCGQTIQYEFGNDYIRELNTCQYIGKYYFDISVPTGKLIFCDWPDNGRDNLMSLEKSFCTSDVDINNKLGRYLMSKGYAAYNIGYFYVGNTSPCVRQKGNVIHIENGVWDEDEEKATIFTDNSFEPKGQVCTDLWWVTAFDLSIYNKLIGMNLTPKQCGAHVVIDVAPGIYRFNYDSDADGWDFEHVQNYLTIEKI